MFLSWAVIFMHWYSSLLQCRHFQIMTSTSNLVIQHYSQQSDENKISHFSNKEVMLDSLNPLNAKKGLGIR